MNQKSLEIASKVLKESVENLKNNYEILEEDHAILFWQSFRGGNSVIVADDGSYLAATSAVSPEKLLSEYRNGRRTNWELEISKEVIDDYFL